MAGVARGDVILCALDPVVGTVQGGTRPAVVVQTDRLNFTSPHTIVVPFTSKFRQSLLQSHAVVPAGNGGLTLDSVALCEQVRVIDNSTIFKVLGHLDAPCMDEIAKALRKALEL